MGDHGSKATCAVCGNELGLIRHRLADKQLLCPACNKKCQATTDVLVKTLNGEAAKKAIAFAEDQKLRAASFSSEKKIGKLLELNETEREFLIHVGAYSGRGQAVVFRYEDLLEFELLEDGTSIARGGLGRGKLEGEIAEGSNEKGMCTSLRMNLTVNDSNHPVVSVMLISAPAMKGLKISRMCFQEAQTCMTALQEICNRVDARQGVSVDDSAASAADEIWRFKNLLDAGVITQEEFEAKKKQLLGL